SDPRIAHCAKVLRDRQLPKCIDIRHRLEQQASGADGKGIRLSPEESAKIQLRCTAICERLEGWSLANSTAMPRILVDQVRRSPYKKFQDSKTLLNQILILRGDHVVDMAEISPVVASAETYEVCRAYVAQDDAEARSVVENEIGTSTPEA